MSKIDPNKNFIVKPWVLIEIVLMLLYPLIAIIVIQSNAIAVPHCADIGTFFYSFSFWIFHIIWFLILIVDKIITSKRKITPHTGLILSVSLVAFIVWAILLAFGVFTGYSC